METKDKSFRLLDNLILFFFFLFCASLTNSIFVNQIGYFGALLLILTKSFLKNENQFHKNGLELALIFFIAAEILATVFSDYLGESFNNLLKRVLLLPLLYVIPTVLTDIKKTKIFFWVYLSFAFISAAVYLFNSYEYYVEGLFQLTGSGPSIFQYPITTSELLSFTIIFFFVFLFYEKAERKYKILLFIGLIVSLLAIVATFKRTGWIGVAGGIGVILLIKKEYRLIIPGLIIIVGLFFMEKNYSNVRVFQKTGDQISEVYNFNTKGRARSILPLDSTFFVSDFEGGVLHVKNEKVINQFSFPSPVESITSISSDDNLFIVKLLDSRLIFAEIRENKLHKIQEILSPGFTTDFKYHSNNLYVNDLDSGLTIYENVLKNSNIKRYAAIRDFINLDVSEDFLILENKNNNVHVFKKNGALEELEFEKPDQMKFLFFYTGKPFFQHNEGLVFYNDEKNSLSKVEQALEAKFIKADIVENKLFLLSNTNEIYFGRIENDKLLTEIYYKLDFKPNSLSYQNNLIYATVSAKGRLSSIFDPYNLSNQTRLSLWSAGWKIFLDNPICGVGDIDLAKYYKRYKSKYEKEIQGHLHNNYIHILAILGITGFIAFIYLFSIIIIKLFRLFNTNEGSKFVENFALASIGCIFAFLVSGLTEWNFGDQEIVTMIWFIVGINFSLNKYK